MNQLRKTENFGSSDSMPFLNKEAMIIDIRKRVFSYYHIVCLFSREPTDGYITGNVDFKDRSYMSDRMRSLYKGVRQITSNDKRYYCTPFHSLDIDEKLQKYVVDGKKALKVAKLIATKMPRDIASLSESTIRKFTDVIDDAAGYDPEVLYFFATNFSEKTTRWGDHYFQGEEYLITDRKLNPIDVDKFLETMEKIIVDK